MTLIPIQRHISTMKQNKTFKPPYIPYFSNPIPINPTFNGTPQCTGPGPQNLGQISVMQ